MSRDEDGLRRLVRQFSTPGRHPEPRLASPPPDRSTRAASSATRSCTPSARRSTTPGCSSPASSATARPRPAPLEGSWKSLRFLNPARDGAVLPVLHLNEYKISGPTVLGRSSDEEVCALLRAHGWAPVVVAGDEPRDVHRRFAAALDDAHAAIAEIQRAARADGVAHAAPLAGDRAAHAEGLDRAGDRRRRPGRGHLPRPPGAAGRRAREPASTSRSSRPGCAPTGPRSASTPPARSSSRLAALAPARRAADGRAAAGQRRHADPPAAAARAGRLRARGRRARHDAGASPRASSARCSATSTPTTPRAFRLFCPDETNSNRLGAVFEVSDRCLMDAARRRRARLARRPRDGGPERASLRGLAGGLPADRPPRAVRDLRGLRDGERVDGHPARQVAGGGPPPALARAGPVAERPAHLDLLAQRPQRLQPPGPRACWTR